MTLIQWIITTREKYLVLAVELLKKCYIDIVHPNRQAWKETTESLANYNPGTLGNALYTFLKNGNIELEPKYESHDVYHVISGYGLGLNNEASLFFFLFGNGKHSISIIGSMLVAIIFMPDRWRYFFRDYKKGKQFKSLKLLDFQYLLDVHYDMLYHDLLK